MYNSRIDEGAGGRRGKGERRGGAYSFVVCLSHLAIGNAYLSRRSTVPTPDRCTSNFRRSAYFSLDLVYCTKKKLVETQRKGERERDRDRTPSSSALGGEINRQGS